MGIVTSVCGDTRDQIISFIVIPICVRTDGISRN